MSSPYASFEATTAQGQTWRLEMLHDEHAESPRESQENLGTMIYSHRRYNLGDERINEGSFQEYLEARNLSPETVVSLPLYLFDHSGLALSTKDFGDRWDSGCVGAIFVSLEKIQEEYGNTSEETISMVQGVLQAEVSEMNEYISGNSFGMRLTQISGGDDQEEPDEVWGFLGSDPRLNGMIHNIPVEVSQALGPVFEAQLGRLPSSEPTVQDTPATRSPRPR